VVVQSHGFFAGASYTIYNLKDLNSFTKLKFGQPTAKHLSFDRSGNLLAAGESSIDCYSQGWIYDVNRDSHHNFVAGKSSTPGPARGGSEQVAFSPNGKLLVIASVYVKTVIIDVASLLRGGVYKKLMELETEQMSKRKFFAWSPDGKTLVSVMDQTKQGRSVDMWLFPKGEDSQIADISMLSAAYKDWQTDPIKGQLGMDFSPNSNWLAAGGGNQNNGVIQILDVQNNKLLGESENLRSEIGVLKFISDDLLVSGSRNGVFTVWRLGLGRTTILEKVEIEQFPGAILALELAQAKDKMFVVYKSTSNLGMSDLDICYVSLPQEFS
jgi:WD40 repeat protein